jgi:hypothetical protein
MESFSKFSFPIMIYVDSSRSKGKLNFVK